MKYYLPPDTLRYILFNFLGVRFFLFDYTDIFAFLFRYWSERARRHSEIFAENNKLWVSFVHYRWYPCKSFYLSSLNLCFNILSASFNQKYWSQFILATSLKRIDKSFSSSHQKHQSLFLFLYLGVYILC